MTQRQVTLKDVRVYVMLGCFKWATYVRRLLSW